MSTQPVSPPLDFARASAQVSQHLNAIEEFSRKLNLQDSIALIREVACRLSEHRFTVAVVGEFKTGKSTFVNALLGVDVVPTDVLPATATLNRMTYGLESSIEVRYKDGRTQSVEFDKLKEFVTKEYVDTDLLESLDEVVVHHPAPYLLNNVDIIDTPGLNDESSMTSVTLSVLPRIDAAILVISGLSPFSEYTRQFLEERLLSADLGRVIFLVNRIGQLGSEEDANRIVSHIEKRIRQNVLDRAKREIGENSTAYEVYIKKIGKPRVFGIDAYNALRGIVDNNQLLLERSRFLPFQNGLRSFLNEDRGAIVLQVPVNRILASANEILMTLNLKRQAANMSLDEFSSKRDAALAELNRVRERKRQDMAAMELRKADAVERALSVIKGMDNRIKAAVRDAISGVELTDEDVEKQKPAVEKVQSLVDVTVRRAAEQESDRVAGEVNRAIANAADHLQKLTTDLEETVRSIVLEFNTSRSQNEQIGAAALGAAALFLGGGLPVIGGIWAGYRHAGLAGAATGGIASFTATTAALTLAAVVGLPFSFPIVVGAALIGFFSGDRITKAIFKGAKAKNFKEKAIDQTLRQLDAMHLEGAMARAAKTHVEETFNRLTQMVSSDVDAVIENTERTLNELARQKERQDALSTEQIRELDVIGERTRGILENVQALNAILTAREAATAV
jgi:ribosome biogenesis GTPase A